MDLFAFIHAMDPTKVRVVERERDENDPRLLETTVGRTVPLLPIAIDRVESELEESVDILFNEGGSGHQTEQGHSTGGGQRLRILLLRTRPQAEVDNLIRSFAPIMTTVTTTTPTFDHTSVTKEKVVEPSLFGAIRTVINPDGDLQKVYVPQWSVTNGSRLDDGRVCHEMVDEFAPLNAKVRMRAEYNVKEKRRLKYVVESQGELLKAGEEEIGSLKARLLLKEAKAMEAIRLRVEASNFKTVEKSLRDEANALRERKVILEKERDALDVKLTELKTSAMSKERELMDLNALVTFVKSQNDSLVDQVHELEISSSGLQEKARWLLTHGIKLAIAKCLNSPEYLSALGTAIGKAIKKDDGPYSYLPGEVVIGATALSLALDASSFRVQQIRKIIANHRSVLRDVFVSLAEPFSTSALTGMEGTSGAVPTTAITLSTTLALTSTVNPISIDDYEFVDADDQAVASGDVASFPNVDDAKLHIPQ
nr:hypothetical protein [Tanacetum cinerariifolium]